MASASRGRKPAGHTMEHPPRLAVRLPGGHAHRLPIRAACPPVCACAVGFVPQIRPMRAGTALRYPSTQQVTTWGAASALHVGTSSYTRAETQPSSAIRARNGSPHHARSPKSHISCDPATIPNSVLYERTRPTSSARWFEIHTANRIIKTPGRTASPPSIRTARPMGFFDNRTNSQTAPSNRSSALSEWSSAAPRSATERRRPAGQDCPDSIRTIWTIRTPPITV